MKLTKLTCMLFVMGAMVMASSCKKQETTESINVVSASWQSDDDTRMYIDFEVQSTKWDQGNLDEANGINSTASVFTSSTGGSNYATFSGPSVGRLKSNYYIFYPTIMAQHGNGEAFDADNRETFTVPATQYWHTYTDSEGTETVTVDRNAIVQAYKGKSLRQFQLTNIFGVARFYIKLSSNYQIHHAELIDNVHNITGTVDLKLPAVDTAQFNQLMRYYATGNPEFANLYASYIIGDLGYNTAGYTDHTKMITLECNGVAGLGYTNHLSLFFGVRPGALNQGFKLKLYFTNGEAVYIDDWANVNDPNECIKPAVIKAFYPRTNISNNTELPGNYSATWRDNWAAVEAM